MLVPNPNNRFLEDKDLADLSLEPAWKTQYYRCFDEYLWMNELSVFFHTDHVPVCPHPSFNDTVNLHSMVSMVVTYVIENTVAIIHKTRSVLRYKPYGIDSCLPCIWEELEKLIPGKNYGKHILGRGWRKWNPRKMPSCTDGSEALGGGGVGGCASRDICNEESFSIRKVSRFFHSLGGLASCSHCLSVNYVFS